MSALLRGAANIGKPPFKGRQGDAQEPQDQQTGGSMTVVSLWGQKQVSKAVKHGDYEKLKYNIEKISEKKYHRLK